MPKYPARLLAKQGDLLLSSKQIDGEHYLGKWVDAAIILKESDGKLSQEAIDVKRIPGFSCNKIPESTSFDLTIKFIDEFAHIYNADWQVGTDGIVPDDAHFQIIQDRQLYYFKVKNINGFTDTYQNPPDKTENKYVFTVVIVHKPLASNYWHFEFEIQSNHNIIGNTSSAWKKLVCSTIRDRVQEIAVFELSPTG